jgi:hypothetical protein
MSLPECVPRIVRSVKMNKALSSICMLLTCGCVLPAESGTADFSVYIHLPMESNVGSTAIGPKLRLGKAEIPVSHVRRVADLPIHVVFVIDVGTHQLSLTAAGIELYREDLLPHNLVNGSKRLSGPPVQELIVVSDDDDDLNGRKRKVLEETMCDSHVRAFSLLVAYRPVYGIRAKSLGSN